MDRLILSSVAGFTLGILGSAYYGLSWPFFIYGIAIAFLFGVLYCLQHKAPFLIALLCILGVSCGIARTALTPSVLPDVFTPYLGSEREVEGRVVLAPDRRETTQRLTVEVEEAGVRTNILVVAPLFPEVSYGETIRAYGTLSPPEPFTTDGGRMFRYDEFLRKDGIFLIMERAGIEVVSGREGVYDHVRGALSDVVVAGSEAFAAALPEPHSSLASGLVLGGKQGLGTELLNAFITSGLVHIVVLSGYNVMIVAEFIMRVFGFFAKQTAGYAGAVSILLFVLAAGAGPASIRAGIMAVIAVYARTIGRTYEAVRALVAAGVLMLLSNPLTLPYDPGFQLSFIATLGLIYGAPIVARRLSFVQSGFLREIMASTIAAQIAVLPLLLYQNGLFSLVALPANLLVLPVVPLAMLLSVIAGVGALLAPFAAPMFGFPAYLVLSYIVGVATVAAKLPFAALLVPTFPFALVLFSYALLAFLTWRLAVHIKVKP